jgi:hypothetical protein
VQAPSNYVVRRRDQILAQMRGLGGASYLNELENPTAPRRAAGAHKVPPP